MTVEPFPALLRRLRRARGWSQQRLAEELCRVSRRPTVTRQEVYRWECGRRHPKMWLPYIAVVLEVPLSTLERAIALPSTTTSRVLDELLPPPLELPTDATRRRLDRQDAERMLARAEAFRRADDVVAGKDLMGPAFRELDSAVAVARASSASEHVSRQLLTAVGELAQIAGWIAHDAGQLQRAEDTWRLGMSAAREAGDATLAAQLVGVLGYQRSNNGREADGVELTEAALREAGPNAPPRARALFWDRVAWAHTKTGDAQAAMRALGRASQALGQHDGEDEPPWVYWVSEAELRIMEARCFTELARPLRAVPLLVDTLAAYDPSHTREYTLYQSWLAVALADANEPEMAADTAMRMLLASADLGSDRITERVRVVLRKLEAHQGIPEVDAVADIARALGTC